MAMARESSFLPTIKCSQCGSQVEISMMGDHICGGGGSQLSPTLEEDESYATQPYEVAYSLSPSSRSPRKPVAVDIYAANKPYTHHDPLTPTSHNSGSLGTPFPGPSPGRPSGAFTPSENGSEGYVHSPLSARRPNGYGALGDNGAYTTEQPQSPGPGVLKRMDTITPGPFDHRRPSAPESQFPSRKDSLAPTSPYPDDRPGTAYSQQSAGSSENVAPPRLPQNNGYEGFGPPTKPAGELQPPATGNLNRSETFPRPSLTTEPPLRTPSAPGTRNERAMQSSTGGLLRKPSMGPDTSRRPPPRTSLIRPARENTGSVDLAREFGVGNPYHTPSDSASSGYSAFSGPSYTSSQTSPARSNTRRQPSDGPRQDRHAEPPTTTGGIDIPRPTNLRVDPTAPPPSQNPLVESPADLSVSANSHRGYFGAPESTTPSGTSPLRDQASPGSYGRWGSRDDSLPTRTGTSPWSRKGTGDLPYRGDCKACQLPIQGKSVSSADGRLTGKYHKACFVCTTCAEPFASAEFYVLEDRPYCEQHYHKLNGSLCGGCGRGIEGQYVADEASAKYHVGCFCCLDCGRSLTDGYFEVDGGAYCEQDAHYRVSSAPAWNAPGSYPPAPYPYGYSRAPAPVPVAPRGPPSRGPMPPRLPQGVPGLPGRPGPGGGSGGPRPRGANPNMPRPSQGPPGMRRPGPGMMPPYGPPGPRPQLNKRSTRLGMM